MVDELSPQLHRFVRTDADDGDVDYVGAVGAVKFVNECRERIRYGYNSSTQSKDPPKEVARNDGSKKRRSQGTRGRDLW